MSAPRPSLSTLVRRLEVTPAEAVALAVLACGALTAVALLWWLHRPLAVDAPAPPGDGEAVTATADPTGLDVSTGEVIVHVAGAVRQPGVYTLAGGSRVGEAVTAAGGPTRRAVLDGLNLARVVADGEQVLVPDRRSQGAGTGDDQQAGAGTTGAKLNLNQATAAEFETLPGIGPVLASRILEYRDSIGGFTEIGQLRDVPGIGEKTFQALAELVSL